MRRGLAALAALFLVAHFASLPPTLEDIDSINFALGVREFDVAHHQPHPPGYPVFIGLGKLATPVMRAAGIAAPVVRGLAIWSAIGGSALLPLIFGIWLAIDGDRWRAAMATAITAACPLFWFSALRPLSDVAGLAAAMAAVLCLARSLPVTWGFAGRRSGRLLMVGALLAGLAIGFRSQTVFLTAPLLALLVLVPQSRVPLRLRIAAVAAGAIGVLLWGIPLVVASGGPSAYVTALGSQAGEDFTGVVMLWTHRSARVAALAAMNTLVLPWDSPALAGVVLALTAAGALILAARSPRVLAVTLAIFGPYAVFHLLFQETVTVRYALPIVLPVAYLAASAIAEARPEAAAAATVALAAAGLWLAVPAGIAFGHTPSPVFAWLDDMRRATPPAPVLAMHRRIFTESRRARKWDEPAAATLLPAPRDYEWLELTRTWREQSNETAWFGADPRRTDLVLVDPESRTTTRYRWPFAAGTYAGGARPDEVDWVTVSHPGWFLERGWALSPEVAGITERDGWGPHKRPSIGWIRRRGDEAMMLIGGRHLGPSGAPPARIVVAIDDRTIRSFEISPGFFLRVDPLPAGSLAGEGVFAKLTVRAEPTSAGGAISRVAIEQFNLQPPEQLQYGYGDGWQEPEYNPQTGRSWRWMSERAEVRVFGPPGDVIVRIEGESPRRYYRERTELSISAGGTRVATLAPSADFAEEVRVPAALLVGGNGRVVLESNRMFIPGDREGSADRRHLSLRIYSVKVSSAAQ